MSKPANICEMAEIDNLSDLGTIDDTTVSNVLLCLPEVLQAQRVFLLTTLPRGGVQVMKPSPGDDLFLREYQRRGVLQDRVTWNAIVSQSAQVLDVSSTSQAGSDSFEGMLISLGFAHALAVPVAAPLLRGYPGALLALRNQAQGAFDDADIDCLKQAAQRIEQIAETSQVSRENEACKDRSAWLHDPASKFFVFDSQGKRHCPKDLSGLDVSVANQLREEVTLRASRASEDVPQTGERVQYADSRGELWNFRATAYHKLPALGEGSFVIYTHVPDVCDWQFLDAKDFAGNSELARLVPALRFMQENFSRGPTLHDIARSVHLSAFHFHRRFTELLGLTPKHFLLDCQIDQARRALARGDRDLASIASDCGFAHQSHFTSRFKQTTGLTPTRWRRAVAQV